MHRLGNFFLALALCMLNSAVSVSAGEFHKAARKGDLDAVRSFVDQGSDLNELDGVIGAPMHWAAARGHIEVVKFLVEAGAEFDLQAAPPDRLTPLQLAASNGQLPTVRYLVGLGAELSAGTDGAGTALHLAAYRDKGEVVTYLLEIGADPFSTAHSIWGYYPLSWAAQNGGVSAIQPLLDTGFPIDEPFHDGTTALHAAVFLGHVDFAKALLEAGANPDSVSTHFTTPRILMEQQDKMSELYGALPPK